MEIQQISKMLQSLLSKLKEITFKSEVQNLPEVQKVEVTNPPAEVVIPEFPKIEIPEVNFESVIKAIEDKVIPLDETATKEQILKELQAIKTALIEPEDEDEGYDIENGVERLIEAVLSLRKEDKELDLSPIIDAIKKIDTSIDWTPLTNLTKDGEFSVKINSKQFENLIKSLGKSISIATGGGGGKTDVEVKNKLVPEKWDYTALTENSDNDVWTFKYGGASAATVATLTITYTDSSKGTISNVSKT